MEPTMQFQRWMVRCGTPRLFTYPSTALLMNWNPTSNMFGMAMWRPAWNENCTGLAQIARLGPTLLTENPYQSPKVGPQFGPTL
jgi:hypothetical protein